MKRIVIGFGPVGRKAGAAAALLPGAFLLGLGLLALFAPKLLATIAAVFFLYLGAIAVILGWKIMQWRRKALAVMEQLNGRVEFHRDIEPEYVQSPEYSQSEQEEVDPRKIILH